jgi:hypothetical protein
MKHLLLTLTISAASLFNAAKANSPITPSVMKSFRTAYGQAKEVQWTSMGNTYRASFKIDEKFVNAYYAADGNWIGTSRYISATELAPKVRTNLRKELKGAWISDLLVLSTNEGDVYFATIENADFKKVVKSDYGRKWTDYRKFEK